MNINRCIDCNRKIDSRSKRCKKCSGVLYGKKYKGKTHPSYKHGKYTYQHYCLDCNKKIGWNAIRCQSCNKKKYCKNHLHFGKKGKEHWNYKDGRCLKKKYCLDCNKRIFRGSKRCIRCRIKKMVNSQTSYRQDIMFKEIKLYFSKVKYNYYVKTKNWRFLDVAIPNLMLDFEYNGMIHLLKSRVKSDKIRTKELNKLGWTVIIIDRNNFEDLKEILNQMYIEF